MLDGKSPEGGVATFSITQAQTKRLGENGFCVKLSHLLKIVDTGLIVSKHVFQGLRRPLCHGEDLGGDSKKLIYSWKPTFDYDWSEFRRFEPEEIVQMPAPAGKIFAVIVTPNENNQYPSVHYWIERWSWVSESPTRPCAPLDWESRYDRALKSYE